ncbi:MAG: hypothetical protein HZB61_02795 [Nitrospirae bacterium]|nr:hypothetical protein [Nitrospirota bacterium]
MSEAKDNRNSRQTERALKILNQAVIHARKKNKDKHCEMPVDCYYYSLKDGMTYEEELLEIFHALVRSGMSPDEAQEKAPGELERINAIAKQFEEVKAAGGL